MKIKANTSLRIIENKKVVCGNCLSSEPTGMEDTVYCRLYPESAIKHVNEFCAQGSWLIGDGVYDFKQAFAIAYRDVAKENPKRIGEEV
jgi:hypothetical protein